MVLGRASTQPGNHVVGAFLIDRFVGIRFSSDLEQMRSPLSTRKPRIGGLGAADCNVVATFGGSVGLGEIIVVEAVEAGAARQDLAAKIGGDAGVVQYPR